MKVYVVKRAYDQGPGVLTEVIKRFASKQKANDCLVQINSTKRKKPGIYHIEEEELDG